MRSRLAVLTFVLGAMFVGLVAAPTLADPPIWETNFGPSLLYGDDEAAEVTLSFPFPYGGTTYTAAWGGTNGAAALGGMGHSDDYPSSGEFESTVDPILSPFWSDLDSSYAGWLRFNDFGDRAVFTWDAVGSYYAPYDVNTFQLQMLADGTIIFGYNGIQPVNPDFFDTDVFVGLTEGNLLAPPTEVDYTADAPFLSDDTVLELFDYGVPHSEFDLDQMNIIFTPQPGGGYSVAVPEPATVGLLAVGGLLAVRRRRRAS